MSGVLQKVLVDSPRSEKLTRLDFNASCCLGSLYLIGAGQHPHESKETASNWGFDCLPKLSARDPKHCVCAVYRGVATESLYRDLDALGSREVMVVMKVEIVVVVMVVVVGVRVRERLRARVRYHRVRSRALQIESVEVHKVLHLPQNLHFEVHKLGSLPRNLHFVPATKSAL